jgi:hypothetical protein
MPLMPMPPIPTKWMGPISRGSLMMFPQGVIVRKGGRSSIPGRRGVILKGAAYWMPPLEPVIGLADGETRWRGMTVPNSNADYFAGSSSET